MIMMMMMMMMTTTTTTTTTMMMMMMIMMMKSKSINSQQIRPCPRHWYRLGNFPIMIINDIPPGQFMNIMKVLEVLGQFHIPSEKTRRRHRRTQLTRSGKSAMYIICHDIHPSEGGQDKEMKKNRNHQTLLMIWCLHC